MEIVLCSTVYFFPLTVPKGLCTPKCHCLSLCHYQFPYIKSPRPKLSMELHDFYRERSINRKLFPFATCVHPRGRRRKKQTTRKFSTFEIVRTEKLEPNYCEVFFIEFYNLLSVVLSSFYEMRN